MTDDDKQLTQEQIDHLLTTFGAFEEHIQSLTTHIVETFQSILPVILEAYPELKGEDTNE